MAIPFRTLAPVLVALFVTMGASAQPITLRARCEPTSEFVIPPPGAFPEAIVAGPDGNLWFTGYPGLGFITTSGAATLIPIASSTGTRDLTFDLEGNLWFTEEQKIGRRSPDGSIAEFTLPAGGRPAGIAVGPDGEIWFTDVANKRLGKLTPAGSFSEIQLSVYPGPITAGPDGNLWFGESGDLIARATPSGSVTEFAIPGQTNPYSYPVAITAGPDGALWFTEAYGTIGRITTAGIVTLFPIPRFHGTIGGITTGPDGNLWFTEYVVPMPYSSATPFGKVWRVTPNGEFSQFSLPTTVSAPTGITTGPDGNLWVTEFYINKIARVSPPSPCSRFTIDLFPRGTEPR